MTFLNPAFLFGLFAAAIPVVLHFLNLRKLKKIEFSTLAFLKELQKTKIKRIKLKQWFLLLLRVLIIIFLVMSFARPTFTNISIGSSAAKTTAVFIIDNTFSMSVISNEGSYFNRAKQMAKSLMNNFQDGDEIAIIPVVNSANSDMTSKTNFVFIRKEIDDLQISYASKTINEAIIKAGQILYQSKNLNKEIYILTDLQKGRLYNSSNELSYLKSLFNSNERIYLVRYNEKEPATIGINELTLNNQIFEKNKKITFSARVTNYSSTAENNSVTSLFLNGKRSAQQSFSLSSNDSKQLSFETTLSDTGVVQASVELEDDDINQDNNRYISFYVPNKIRLLILTDNRDDAKFVKLALGDQSDHGFQITETNLSQISSANLRSFDAVIIIGSENTPGTANLISYIKAGGGLILMPGSRSSLQGFKNLCKNLNLPLPTTAVGKIDSQEVSIQFDKVDLNHPLFSDLFEEKGKTKIESPDFYQYFRINPSPQGKSVISMFDNSVLLSDFKLGTGKILLFSSAPLLNWNNFPLKSIFAPLINKSVLYSSSKVKEEINALAGSEVLVSLQNLSNPQIKIVRPDNSTEFINKDSVNSRNFFAYNNTDLAGTYQFFSGSKLLDYISINHNPKESVTQHESISAFEEYLNNIGFEGRLIDLSPDKDFSKEIYQSRFGTELWKYFIILSLIFALIEMMVAKSSKKDIDEARS